MPSDKAPATQPEPARVQDFFGYQVWREPDGTPRLTLFRAGHMTELKPDPVTAAQPDGFYDFEHQPVPAPI